MSYFNDPTTEQPRYPDKPGHSTTRPHALKPRTVSGVVGLIVSVVALTLSWVPIVNNIAFFFALISGVFGIIGTVAARPAGKKSGRGIAVSSLVITCLTVAVVLGTQSMYGHALDGTAKSLSPSVSLSAGKTSSAAGRELDGVTRFGASALFKDGSVLTCGKPVTFRRSEFAAGGENATVFLKSKCTFVNRSGKVFKPAGTSGSMSAGGVEGDSVFQTGFDAPDNPVLPGKSVTWWMGYGVVSAEDVQLTVRLGFLDYSSVTFTG
jgi:hypothetical protein